MKDLDIILSGFSTKKILVVGDIMLDHYIWGTVERISPEAPVPVLDVQKEDFRLGGAANVALSLKALGAQVYLCGTIGNDETGIKVKELLNQQEIHSDALIEDKQRHTTRKTRIGAVNQQIVRIDHEDRIDLPAKIEQQVISKIKSVLPMVDAVIIEDYNKGLLTESIIKETIAEAGKLNKIICVDPKQKNFFLYHKVDVFKPNFAEMQKNLGLIFDNEEEFDRQARQLQSRLLCLNLVITRGEKGLYVYAEDGKIYRVPSYAREVYDVSGAGDTVISALALALCEGCDIETAALIANHAAGIVCGKKGTASATIDEIRKSWYEHR
jgi:rfaE bifunctional protein kinase chain/domain